jgi:uncharacterized protein YjcR
MTIKEKKEVAKELFLQTSLTQKDIAEKLGISEQALTKWKQEENWAELKLSISSTEQKVYVKALKEIEKLQEEGRFDSKAIAQYTRFLNQIRPKEEVKISILINGMIEFANWLEADNLELAQQFNKLQLEFISEKLAKLKRRG